MTAVLPPQSLVPPLDLTSMVVDSPQPSSPSLQRADSDATAASSSSSSDSNSKGSSSCTSNSHNHLTNGTHQTLPTRKSKSQLLAVSTDESSLALTDALNRLAPPLPSPSSRRSSIASNSSSNAWKLEFRGMVKLVKWASRRKKVSHTQPLDLNISPVRPRSSSKPPIISPVKRGLSLVDALQLGPVPINDSFPIVHQRIQLVDPSSSTIVHLPVIAPSPNPQPSSLGRTLSKGPSHNNDDLNASNPARADTPDVLSQEPSSTYLHTQSSALSEVNALAVSPKADAANSETIEGANRVLDLSSDDENSKIGQPSNRDKYPGLWDQEVDEFGNLGRNPLDLDTRRDNDDDDDDDDEEKRRRQLHVKRERRRRGLSVTMPVQPTRVSIAVSAPPVSVSPAVDDKAPSRSLFHGGNGSEAQGSTTTHAEDLHRDSHQGAPDVAHEFVLPLSPTTSSTSHGHFVGTRSDVGHQLYSPSTLHGSPPKRRPTSAGSGSSPPRRRRSRRGGLPMSVKDSLKRSLTVSGAGFTPIVGHDALDPRLLNKAKRQNTLARATSASEKRPRTPTRLLGSPLSMVSALTPITGKENQHTLAAHQTLVDGHYGGSTLSVSSFLAGSQPPVPPQSPDPRTLSLPASAHVSTVDLAFIPHHHTATSSHQDDSVTTKKLFKRRAGSVGAIDFGMLWSSGVDSWTLHDALDKPAGLLGTTLVESPPADSDPHPPSTWFNSSTGLFRGASAAGQRRQRPEKPTSFETLGTPTPARLPTIESSSRDMPAGYASHSRSVSTSSIASSFFGGLNRARTFSARSQSGSNMGEGSSPVSRTPSLGVKLRPSVILNSSDATSKTVLIRDHSTPPIHPLPLRTKASLNALNSTDPSPTASPIASSSRHTIENGGPPSPIVTFADASEEGPLLGRRHSKPESPRRLSGSQHCKTPLTTLAFTGTRGYYESQLALEASCSTGTLGHTALGVEDPLGSLAIGRSLSDPNASMSGNTNGPRNSLLITSPSSPNFISPRPDPQAVSIYDFPKVSPVSSTIDDGSSGVVKSDSRSDVTHLPPAEEAQPDHPRPPRAHRPMLVHRPSTTSAQRWTIAISDIPDDGDFLKELDKLKQAREARYAAASGKGSSQSSLLRGRSPKKPTVALMGEAALMSDAARRRGIDGLEDDDQDDWQIVSQPAPEESSHESDSQKRYEGEDREEEIVWMKARRAMLCVREILRTECNYRNNLIRVYEADSQSQSIKVPPLFMEHLPKLISASVALLSGLEDDPSAWGVSAAFLGVETQLEDALVAWCQVVGQVMLELADNGGSSSTRTSFYRKSSGGSKEKKDKGSPTDKESKKGDSTLTGSIGKKAGKSKNRPVSLQVGGGVASSSWSPLSMTSMKTSPGNGSKPFTVQDIAITPSQRVGRYVLLFNELLQQTPLTSPSRALVERALEGATRIAKACNDAQQHPDLANL